MGEKTVLRAKIDEVGAFRLLSGVDPVAICELLATGRTLEVDAGEMVIAPEAEDRRAYLILSGRLNIHVASAPDEPIALAEPGDLIGELSILNRGARSAFVVAARSSRLLVIDETTFWELVNHSHTFAVNLLRHLAQRLRNNNDSLARNADLRSKFEYEAHFDALTGIRNRRWFDEALPRLVDRYRTGPPLCLMSLDIDLFKRVNDSYGHPAGDQVLTAVAHTLASGLRPLDVIARVGGEEFAIILPDAPLDTALGVAERLRAKVEQTGVLVAGGQHLHVTLSIGVAELRSAEGASALYAAGDAALYQAKQGGRNRVQHR